MDIQKPRRFETTDRAHADLFNEAIDQLNVNDERIAKRAEEAEEKAKTYTDAHASKKNNPHAVTKSQVGLSNVINEKQATKAEFDSHNNDNERHITASERSKWDGSQIFNITSENGQGKVYIGVADDFHEVLPQYTGLIHFTATGGASNSPGNAVRGIWTCNATGEYGQVIAFDNANRTYRKTVADGKWSDWIELASAADAQLYKITGDNGRRTKLADGTDLLTMPTGFYYAIGHVVQNNPVENDSSWFNYDVIETGAGRKTIHAWRSYDNTLWHGTVHTDGVFKGWKRIITDVDFTTMKWYDLTLINGNKAGGRKPQYAIWGNQVFTRGEVVSPDFASVFAVLPADARPTTQKSMAATLFGTTGTSKYIAEPTGELRLVGKHANIEANISGVSLDNSFTI
ncbi:hypothetical protein P9D36_18990 [Bacillus haynesii]|uniref:hypothetical protein n=1 Tax=Bacillus haynesii TaxID=1925021 RepID=UPI0022817D45|nr:hypothetical protein [Bacillus haynesii]MCY8369536.1 hypothetical protein [Bacillus haynesii]MEC1449432.1 hypothetical protein [Bacillus haynesii]